ncbi:MAG: amidohydrolase family protein [archaeon]|nr:amidohydrolase family protein [archaeon]
MRKSINKGKLLGPRILAAGLGISPTGGHGGFSGIVADSSVEIRKIVRKNLRNDIDCLKIMSTGGVMDAKRLGEAGAPQMTIEEIETACFEAHRGGILVATHCESTKGIEEALAGGCDTIEHGADIPDELVPLFLDNPKTLRGYTAYSTTLMAGMGISTLPPKVTNVSQMSHENGKLVEVGMIKGLQKAYKEGIRICMGTDASVPYSPHYEMWKELKLYLHYVPEMTNQEVIYFATKSSAEIIGVDDVTGSIEVGKSADLQVVAENPLENIETLSDVKQVMIRGHLIENPSFKKLKALEEVPVDKLIEV